MNKNEEIGKRVLGSKGKAAWNVEAAIKNFQFIHNTNYRVNWRQIQKRERTSEVQASSFTKSYATVIIYSTRLI